MDIVKDSKKKLSRTMTIVTAVILLVTCLSMLSVNAYAEEPEQIATQEAPLTQIQTDSNSTDTSGLNIEIVTGDGAREDGETPDPTKTETITVSTDEVTVTTKAVDALQTEIDAAIYQAVTDSKKELVIEVNDSVHKNIQDTTLKIENTGTIEKIVIKSTNDGAVTVKNENIEVHGNTSTNLIVQILNILFTEKNTLVVDGNATVEIGSEGKALVSGEFNVVAGNDESGKESSGHATVYARDGTKVTSDIDGGNSSVTVSNSSGDSVTVYDYNVASIRTKEKEPDEGEDPSHLCKITVNGKDVTVIKSIEAWNANVFINSPVVELEELAVNETNKLRSLKIISQSNNKNVFDLTQDIGLNDIFSALGVTDVLKITVPVDATQVNIKSSIKALKDISVYSFVTQHGALLQSEYANVAFNVKMGSSSINVYNGVELKSGGSIELKTSTQADAGFDEYHEYWDCLLPLAFNIFIENSSINVEGATLKAENDITLDALSNVDANASCAFGYLFAGVAFNVIVNEASVIVGPGQDEEETNNSPSELTSDKGNVNVYAKANTFARASAKRSVDNKDIDGMYFATNVIMQHAKAYVGEGTEISALLNVNIISTSNVDANDDAIASSKKSLSGKTEEQTKIGTILTLVAENALPAIGNKLLGHSTVKAIMKYGTKFLESGIGKKVKTSWIDGAFNKIAGIRDVINPNVMSIEIDSASLEKGTISAGASKDLLKIKIDSKYNVEAVYLRYVVQGEANYRVYQLTQAADGSYSLDLNNTVAASPTAGDIYFKNLACKEVKVYVKYGAEKSGDEQEIKTPDEDDTGSDTINWFQLFERAAQTSSEDDGEEDCGGNVLITYDLGTTGGQTGNIVTDVTYGELSSGTLNGLKGVARGKSVRFNVIPSLDGDKITTLKKLTAIYKNSEGKEQTVEIVKNSAGHYVFTVPQDIQVGTTEPRTDLTIKAEWDIARLDENPEEKPVKNQVTGSLGVGVVINTNAAVVDLESDTYPTHTIEAEGVDGNAESGIVTVRADGKTTIYSLADGTAVLENNPDTTVKANTEKYQQNTYHTYHVTGKTTGYDTLNVYGESKVAGSATTSLDLNGSVYTVTLVPETDKGYTLPDSIELFIIGEDSREHKFTLKKDSNNKYSVDIKNINFKKDEIKSSDQKDTYKIQKISFVAKYNVITYKVGTEVAKVGEETNKAKVTLTTDAVRGSEEFYGTVTPDKGYIVSAVKLMAKNSAGEDVEVASASSNLQSFTLTAPLDSQLKTYKKDSLKVVVTLTKLDEADKTTISVASEFAPYIAVSTTEGYQDEKITVSGINGKLKKEKILITYDGGTITLADDMTFVIPSEAKGKTISIKGDGIDYREAYNVEIKLQDTTDGTIVLNNTSSTKTGPGDVIYIKVTPSESYSLKTGTLKGQYVKNGETKTILAQREAENLYKIVLSNDVPNSSNTEFKIFAEFVKSERGLSAGVAISVNVGVHRNNALIKSGTIYATNGINLEALTSGSASTQALAGYSTAKTGIAGAVAVEVVSYKTNAIISEGVTIGTPAGESEEGQDLNVKAASDIAKFYTYADASRNSGLGRKAGVGTGIAVAVNGVDTYASISDGVIYDYDQNAELNNISVTATNTVATDEVDARAGAKSTGNGVSPVVALNIYGSNAKAYLGKFVDTDNDTAKVSAENIAVKAKNVVTHKMTLDATASGADAAMAGTFGINILSDTAKAILSTVIEGQETNINVDSQSDSTLTALVKSGATGAKEGKKAIDDSKGSSDQKADGIIKNGTALAAGVGMDAAPPASETITNRQQAQTGEGTVAGAAAFLLNIQKNISEARINDNSSLGGKDENTVLGDVEVYSSANTSASLTADASAASKTNMTGDNSKAIGVAVAINIINSKNNAYIGKGTTNANSVTVLALTEKDAQGKDIENKFKTYAISGASAGSVGVAGSVALAVLNGETSARINKAQTDYFNSSYTKVNALDIRNADTVATAAAINSVPDKNASKTDTNKTADADSGKSIGVGASFAMVYGDNSVIAEFVAPEKAVTGELSVTAVSSHDEESTAVAGQDPYGELFSGTYKYTGSSTNIALDAAVAVNAVSTTVNAKLIPANTGYTPNISAKTVRVIAREKGKSKTDSSGYAVGSNTAVGGSVAVNLNTSNVESINECFLKVSGDDYDSDDDDPHRCDVEIYASSEVTEENVAYALAANTDAIRYIEKFKSYLSKSAQWESYVQTAKFFAEVIQKFLDGTYFKEIQTEFDKAKEAYEQDISVILNEVKANGFSTKDIKEHIGNISNHINPLLDKIKAMLPDPERVKRVMTIGNMILAYVDAGTRATKKIDDATSKATSSATTSINGSAAGSTQTALDNNANTGNKEKESMQVAAAIGVSISNHKIHAYNHGQIEATKGGVTVEAENNIHSMAHAIGASASPSSGGFGSIALAIAVKVDKNETFAETTKSITVADGQDIVIRASLTENVDEEDKTIWSTTIGTEAIAGSITGGAKFAAAGALAVFVSSSKTRAIIDDSCVIKALGGSVQVEAYEIARQTLRTTAITFSSANLSLAISAGVFDTSNELTSKIGKNAVVNAGNVEVASVRASVSIDGQSSGITTNTEQGTVDYGDSSSSAGDEKTGPTGITIDGMDLGTILVVDTKKTTGSDSHRVIEGHLDKENTKKLLSDVFNCLSKVDYYIAVDAGSVATAKAGSETVSSSSGVGSIAGSVAVVIINNTVSALIDEGAQINSSGNISVEAQSAEQTRIISGAISADTQPASKVSAGAVIAFLEEGNVIKAEVNDKVLLNAKDQIQIYAGNAGQSEVYTVTASGSGQTTADVAATIDVIVSNTSVTAKLGNPETKPHSAKSAYVIAYNGKNLRNITLSIAASDGAKVQIGGAVAVIIDTSKTIVDATATKLNVTGTTIYTDPLGNRIIMDSIEFIAYNSHDLFNIVCSASVAAGAAGLANVAGVVSVIVDESTSKVDAVKTELKSNTENVVQEYCGNIALIAQNYSTILNANLEAAIGTSKVAVGAAVTVNVVGRTVEVNLCQGEDVSSIALNNGDFCAGTQTSDSSIIIACGVTGSSRYSINGTICVVDEHNNVKVNAPKITVSVKNAGISITEGGNVYLTSFCESNVYGVAGAMSFTSGQVAVGATILTLVNDNTANVIITDANIEAVKEIDIAAYVYTEKLVVSIGAGGSTSVAVEGSIVTVVSSDKLEVALGKAVLSGSKIVISAYANSSENIVSGALVGSGTVSVGPSIVVFVKNRTIKITSSEGGKIGSATGAAVNVNAAAEDDIFTLVLAVAASTGSASVSVGSLTEIINNTVLCDIDADVNAGANNEVEITAVNNSTVRNFIFGGGFAANAGVVPVVTVIYTKGSTLADVSGKISGYKVSILADSSLNLREVSVGAAVAGTAGVSGTVAVVVNSSTTKSLFTGSADVKTIIVKANDVYDFESLMLAIGGGGAAGVAVNAAVTVAKNTVEASVGNTANHNTINAATVEVEADSVRNVRNIIGAGAFGGTAGVGVNIAVVVAGSKLPKDAYDMLTNPDGSTNAATSTTYNPDTIISNVSSGNKYVNNMGYLNDITLKEDTLSNDQNDSSIRTKAEEIDGKTIVEGLDSDSTVDYTIDANNNVEESSKTRGEDSTIDPSDAAQNNEKLGDEVKYKYSDAPKCSVTAKVVNLTITSDVLSIIANDTQSAELDTVNVSGGATVGASAGVSVLVLHSNVLADLDSNTTVYCRDLRIEASSTNTENEDIEIISGVAGVGIVGAAVVVAVVHLDNDTEARLSGTVYPNAALTKDKEYKINVRANSSYKDVSAEVIAVGAGTVGVTASVAVVTLNGNVNAVVDGQINADAEGGFSAVNVIVCLENNVTAGAASFTAAGAAGAIGVAVASEQLKAKAAIEQGNNPAVTTKVELGSYNKMFTPTLRVMVVGTFDESTGATTQGEVKAKANINAGSAGVATIGAAVAVAVVKPTIDSYISAPVNNAQKNLIIYVLNSIYTKSETGLNNAAFGEGTFGANVLVSTNRTKSNAYVSSAVNADTLNILSLLSANAVSSMKQVEGALLGIGISTAISILKAENEARVDNEAEVTVKTLNIFAGADTTADKQKGAEFYSDAYILSASGGLNNVSLNVAVAYNNAKNSAKLILDGTAGYVKANNINVFAYGNPTASSKTKMISICVGSAKGSSAASTLTFVQKAEVNCNEINAYDTDKLPNITVVSYMYPGESTDPEGETVNRDYKQANASVDIFQISGMSLKANVAYAKNNTESTVSALLGKKVGNIKAINNGSANAEARLVEVGGDAAGIGSDVCLSYVQAKFITSVDTHGVDGDIEAKTDYVSHAQSTVQAESKELAGLNVNVLVAKSTTVGTTTLEGNASSANAIKANNVSVSTIGNSSTLAQQLKPNDKLNISLITIAGNVIESILDARAKATIQNAVFASKANVSVTSELNASGSNSKHDAAAEYNGASANNLTAVSAVVNVVIARNKAENEASATNISCVDTIKLNSFAVIARSHADAYSDGGNPAGGDGLSLALKGMGVILSKASNDSKNTAQVDDFRADVTSLTVNADMTRASAEAIGGTSAGGVNISVESFAVNTADALNNAQNKALLSKCKVNTNAVNADNVKILAQANNVYAKSLIGSTKLDATKTSVSLISVGINVATAKNNYKGYATVTDSLMNGKTLNVESYENDKYYSENECTYLTESSVGSAGTSNGTNVSLISTDGNSAKAENVSEILAKIETSVLTGYKAAVVADGRADVKAAASTSDTVGLYNTGIISTYAQADGTVNAVFNPTETQSVLETLTVKSVGVADAESITSGAGSLVAGETFNVNESEAKTDLKVYTTVSGGKLKVNGLASIGSYGTARIDASAYTPRFELTQFNATINDVKANSNIDIKTSIVPGTYEFGTLEATASIPSTSEDKSHPQGHTAIKYAETSTTATVMPSAGGKKGSTSINLIGATEHLSTALSKHLVTLIIGSTDGTNTGTIKAGTATFKAIGNGATNATAKDVDETYGFMTIGGSVVNATEADDTQMFFGLKSLEATSNIDAKADNQSSSANAYTTTPGGFSVASVQVAKAEARIGSKDSNNVVTPQTARITVLKNGDIKSTNGNVSFKAANSGKGTAKMIANKSSGAVAKINDAGVPAYLDFLTEIVFEEGSKVTANKKLKMDTVTRAESDSEVSQQTSGAGLDVSVIKGETKANNYNHIVLGKNAALKAETENFAVNMQNSCGLQSVSDYNSGFELIGVHDIKATTNFTAKNIFEMEEGSSIEATKGNVEVTQESQDIVALTSAENNANRAGGVIKDGTATGINNITTDNSFKYNVVNAGNTVQVYQYSGAKKAEAFAKADVSSNVVDVVTAGGENNVVMNNNIEALTDGDMTGGEKVVLAQGSHLMNYNAGARPYASGGIFAKVNGSAKNDITVNNTVNGGSTDKIDEDGGDKRVYVSDLDAEGTINCDLKKGQGGLINYGSTKTVNNLNVKSTLTDNYSLFDMYQNEFPASQIVGNKDGKQTYDPSGLEPYIIRKRVAPSSHEDNYYYNGKKQEEQTENNIYVNLFLDKFNKGEGGRALGSDEFEFYISEEGKLVLINSLFFAANVQDLDAAWLREFLEAENVRFKVSTIDGSDIFETINNFISHAMDISEIYIGSNVIRLKVSIDGVVHTYEIYLSGTGCDAYEIIGADKVPVSLMVIDNEGIRNVIIIYESPKTRSAFVFIPEESADDIIISVKLKNNSIAGMKLY